MYLFDCEDFYSVKIQLNIKKGLEEIAAGLENEEWKKLLTCEHFWNGMDTTDKTSVKDTAMAIESTINEIKAENLEFFSERRLLILKNRLVLCDVIQRGEAALEQAVESLIQINLKEAMNVVSQQNLAVLALTQGRVQETMVLVKKAIEADSVL
jgi:hypothetical protein